MTETALFIAVHLRRTDMMAHMGQDYGVDYLYKSFKYAIDRFHDRCLLFVVCSDDKKWSRDHLPAIMSNVTVETRGCRPQITFSDSHDAAQDLAILASCNHSIITMGTFGWWAAYLGGGDVIYFNKDLPLSKAQPLMINYEDIYLPTWIGIS